VLPYVWLSLALVWLWLPPQVSADGVPPRVAVSAGFLALAVAHAYATGIVTPLGIIAILAFALLCYCHSASGQRPALHAATTIVTILFSLALMAHVVPGFSNLLVVRDAVLSPGAVPYTLYLNFDKAQIGLFLLAFGPRLMVSRTDWAAMLEVMLPAVFVLIAVLMPFALAIGQVRFDIKQPDVLPIWAWSNLLFTCAAEEALFRGVIQRWLQGESAWSSGKSVRGVLGLAFAAIVFGAAHFAGGVWSVVLAAIAGIGYGWIYWRTKRIEASILAHFLVNTTHIMCFTYPARV
jgi:membrane protease YdiL (CAAX protease family)